MRTAMDGRLLVSGFGDFFKQSIDRIESRLVVALVVVVVVVVVVVIVVVVAADMSCGVNPEF